MNPKPQGKIHHMAKEIEGKMAANKKKTSVVKVSGDKGRKEKSFKNDHKEKSINEDSESQSASV